MGKINYEDRVLIKHYRLKGFSARKILKEFPTKPWSRSGIDKLIKKIETTSSIERKAGSGRPRSTRDAETIETIEELALSQEGAPNTHLSQREITKFTGIPKSTVQRVIKQDLKKRPFRKVKAQKLTEAHKKRRVECAKRFLRNLTWSMVKKTFFTDEKVYRASETKE